MRVADQFSGWLERFNVFNSLSTSIDIGFLGQTTIANYSLYM